MKNLKPKIIVGLLFLGILAAASAVQARESLTSHQISDLREIGLADYTADALKALHSDPAANRDPEMSFEIVKKMLEADLPDDVIRLLIGLDWLTIRDSKIPIKPEKILDLYISGADIRTVRAMLAAEVATVNQKMQTREVDLDHAGWNAVGPDKIQPGPGIIPERLMPVLPDPQAEMGDLKLGRQKLTRPDGKQVIVYRSPFEDHTTRLGRRIYRKPDGKQTVIYSSPFDQPAPARLGRVVLNRPDGKQVVIYTSANPKTGKNKERADQKDLLDPREIMEQLRLNVDMNQYLPRNGRGRRRAPDAFTLSNQ